MTTKRKDFKSRDKLNFIRGGIVKGVPNGDTLQILLVAPLDKDASNGPTEYEVGLVGIKAPLIGSKSRPEQEWSYQSREFLRKRLIGKSVLFQVSAPGLGSRRHGMVYFDGSKDIRETIVSCGWAEVITRMTPNKNDKVAKDMALLTSLQEEAKQKAIGVWSKSTSESIRTICKFDAVELFKKVAGQKIEGVVDYVRTATNLRIYLPSFGYSVLVTLSAISAPQYKHDATDAEYVPFARTARFYAELVALHHDATIVLSGIDNSNNFYGDVWINDIHLASALLEQGLAQCVDPSTSKEDTKVLRRAETKAREANLRLWSTSAIPLQVRTSGEKVKRSWGRVTDIINVGMIQVVELKDGRKGKFLGDQLKLSFSSLQIPRYIPRERIKSQASLSATDVVIAYEAKEYLRKNLLGQCVQWTLDYVRPEVKKDAEVIPRKSFYSVYLNGQNIAIDLVSSGYATTLNHRGSDKRSPEYQELIMSEIKAKKQQLGLHSPHKVKMPHFNDLTTTKVREEEGSSDVKGGSGNVSQSSVLNRKQKQEKLDMTTLNRLQKYLPHLQHAGSLRGVVEKVYSSNRYKIWIEKEASLISFSIVALASEKMTPASSVNPISSLSAADGGSHIGNHIYLFIRDLLHQRDVNIVIYSIDRRGNFVGTLEVDGVDLTSLLLRKGYARLSNYSKSKASVSLMGKYKALEQAAKDAHMGLWVDWNQEAEDALRLEQQQKRAHENEKQNENKFFFVKVTSIVDGNRFFYVVVEDKSHVVEELTQELNRIVSSVSAGPIQELDPKVGQVVAAKFAADDKWYRARIDSVKDDQYVLVHYIDYGNKETVSKDRLLPLPLEFVKLYPPQAHEACLAHIQCMKMDEEHGPLAAEFLWSKTADKTLVANVQYYDNSIPYMILGDPTNELTVNCELVRNGMAHVGRGHNNNNGSSNNNNNNNNNTIVNYLKSYQDGARKNHLGIWQYGDILESDNE